MPYAVVIVRKFNVKANGRVFNRALCRRLELHVPPAPGLCLKFPDGSGKAKIDTVTDEPEAGTAWGVRPESLEACCHTEPGERLAAALAAGWVDLDEAAHGAMREQ